MNQFVPNWSSNMGDAFAPLCGEDDGLMELLWCNGPVVLQNQAPRKPPPRSDKEAAAAAQENEAAAAWLQFPAAVEDPLERDLFSELFGETPAADKEEERAATAAAAATAPRIRMMPPPRHAHAPTEKAACMEDVGVVSDCEVGKTDGDGAAAATEAGESSMLTIGSSFCGSNHVQTARPPPRAGARDAATVNSSSMQPRSSGAAAHRSGKRKQHDAAETEDAEFESAAVTCEPAQKLTTAKRRRAAEVHNLSERRRRDRINEKMKALQELIPYCNKTDKASMLDEAIEYLKSLQLQLQVMWMGGGMAAATAPVMIPAGVHQYMQQMVAPPQVASMPRMPFMAAAPAPAQSSPVGHVAVADPYARCLAVDRLQTPSPMHYLQGVSFYQQQSPAPPQSVVPGGSLPAATARTLPSDSTLQSAQKTRKFKQS